MSAMAEVPLSHPLRENWEGYKLSFDYSQTRAWAMKEAHVDGSLWAAFSEGWQRALVANPAVAKPLPEVVYDGIRLQRHMKDRGYNVDIGTVTKILDAVVAIYDLDQKAKPNG